LGLALVSLVLMFADSRSDYMVQVRYYVAYAVTPLHYVAQLPGRGLNFVGGLFESRNQLQRENARLQDQLLIQQYQLQKLEHLTVENRRLNELLNASTVVNERVVRVEMIGESPDPFSKRIVIGKGKTDGVYIGQAVFDAYGLMGQVVEVLPFTSWVLLITDPQHATPVQVNRNGNRAIASGTRDSLHLLNLDNIPNTTDIQVGDELVTSGLGERFPAGYPVGVVTSVANDPGKPFATVVVTPTAQIDRSRNLLLVFDSRTKPVPASGDASGNGTATDSEVAQDQAEQTAADASVLESAASSPLNTSAAPAAGGETSATKNELGDTVPETNGALPAENAERPAAQGGAGSSATLPVSQAAPEQRGAD
jgi:rod shape-determining protein MreC